MYMYHMYNYVAGYFLFQWIFISPLFQIHFHALPFPKTIWNNKNYLR